MVKNSYKLSIIFILMIIVVSGLYTKKYSGVGYEWVNSKLGGVFYEIFWCIVLYLFLKKKKPLFIAILVFVLTSALEFLQLYSNSFLELVRSTFLGHTLLGSTFNPVDFIYYLIGSFLGFLILRINKDARNKKTSLF